MSSDLLVEKSAFIDIDIFVPAGTHNWLDTESAAIAPRVSVTIRKIVNVQTASAEQKSFTGAFKKKLELGSFKHHSPKPLARD